MAMDEEHLSENPEVPPSTEALPRWWTSETVAVVTGANKGLGYEMVRKLATEGMTVVLTARDKGRGLKATQDLHAQNLNNVVFHQLDVANANSVTRFINWLRETYHGLDILVNNAAVGVTCHTYHKAVECLNINYFGTIDLTEKLLPLFKDSAARARIINISSLAGFLALVKDEELRQKLSETSSLDQDFIDNVAKKYEAACQAGSDEVHGYGLCAYYVSRLLLNVYTRLLAQKVGSRMYVHCVHPGVMFTDMLTKGREIPGFDELLASGELGEIVNVSEGADTPIWLALLPPGGPSGLFWFKRAVLSYYYWS